MTRNLSNDQGETWGKERGESDIGLGVALGPLFGLMLGQLAIGLSLGVLGGTIADAWRKREGGE